eukprot:242633_1
MKVTPLVLVVPWICLLIQILLLIYWFNKLWCSKSDHHNTTPNSPTASGERNKSKSSKSIDEKSTSTTEQTTDIQSEMKAVTHKNWFNVTGLTKLQLIASITIFLEICMVASQAISLTYFYMNDLNPNDFCFNMALYLFFGLSGRMMLYQYFIYRVHIIFEGSTFGLTKKRLRIYQMLLFLSMAIDLIFYLIILTFTNCDQKLNVLMLGILLMLDIFWACFCCIIFVYRLRQLIKFQ